MNEELQKALAEIIIGALETAEQTKAFVLAEMPDVVQQLLAWKMAQSLIISVLWVGVFAGAITFVWWKFAPRPKQKLIDRLATLPENGCSRDRATEQFNEDNTERWIACLTVTVFCTPIAVAVFCTNLDWLQIWLAPKVYLIEYAASLVK